MDTPYDFAKVRTVMSNGELWDLSLVYSSRLSYEENLLYAEGIIDGLRSAGFDCQLQIIRETIEVR